MTARPRIFCEAFGEQLERMGGELSRPNPADPLAPVRDKISGAKVICFARAGDRRQQAPYSRR